VGGVFKFGYGLLRCTSLHRRASTIKTSKAGCEPSVAVEPMTIIPKKTQEYAIFVQYANALLSTGQVYVQKNEPVEGDRT
jgi:hypothetical protein